MHDLAPTSNSARFKQHAPALNFSTDDTNIIPDGLNPKNLFKSEEKEVAGKNEFAIYNIYIGPINMCVLL